MKKTILLTLGFVLTIQIGAFLTDKVKALVAESLNYEGRYFPQLGRSLFHSNEMGVEFDEVRKFCENNASKYKKSPEWTELIKKDEKDHAIIEVAGLLFTFLITALGLWIFFKRSNDKDGMNSRQWLGILMGLFFMRQVVINLSILYYKTLPCDEAKLWRWFHLPVWTSTWIFTILGLVLFFFILYKIPPNSRLLFLSSGFIGAVLGLYLWLFYFSKILL